MVYDALRRNAPPRVRQAIRSQKWAMGLIASIMGSGIYSKSYYTQIEDSEKESALVIGEWIISNIRPSRIVDVGCGPGHLLEVLAKDCDVLGLDYSEAAKAIVLSRGLPFCHFDLTSTSEQMPNAPWDLAVCCEVAEHLDERHADTFVGHLAAASATIFLTAAESGQGGLNHVNEQPNAYWKDKFSDRGFRFEEGLTQATRAHFLRMGVVHYLAKPMIFRKVL
jgi:trans-aconitate methyltransferase